MQASLSRGTTSFAVIMFEFCVGLFWPSMMKMRTAHVLKEMQGHLPNYVVLAVQGFHSRGRFS